MRKILTILLFLGLGIMSVSAQRIVPAKEIFIYGVGFNPMDSVVYMTDIQPLNGTFKNKKNGFLFARSEYSAKLKEHISSLGARDITTSVTYAETPKAALKKYNRLKKKFAKDKSIIKYITTSGFQFSAVAYEPEEE